MSHQQQGAEPVTHRSKSIKAQLLWHRDGAGLCQAAEVVHGCSSYKTGPEFWLTHRHVLFLLIINIDNFASLHHW